MSIAYQLLSKIHNDNKPLLYIADSASDAERLTQDLGFLLKSTGKKAAYFPGYEVAFTDALSPANSIIATRLSILHQIINKQISILVMTPETLCTLLPTKTFVESHVLSFTLKQIIHLQQFKQTLINCGYVNTANVTAPQQFAIRGAIIDLYPPSAKQAIRIELDDDTIDSLHYFDTLSQRSSKESLERIQITPVLEYSPEAIDIDYINTHYQNIPSDLLKRLKKGDTPTGWHRYLHLFYSDLNHIFHYLGHDCHIFAATSPETIINHGISASHEHLMVPLSTQRFIMQHINGVKKENQQETFALSIDNKTGIEKLKKILKKKRVLLVCQSYFRMHQLESTLLSHHISFDHVDAWYAFSSKEIRLGICQGALSQPIYLSDEIIIPEHTLTEKVIVDEVKKDQPSMHHEQLNIGDLLVHVDHGVGKFMGIETRTINQIPQDFVIIEYLGNDKLLFPPDQLFKIHPFHGNDSNIDALKSKSWARRKEKAIKNIEVFSAKLLRLQSSRQDNVISKIQIPDEYTALTDSFPFTETNDQINIMDAIIHDYQQTTLFDRLVCGDVGFGKTEIAMRTAFIALMNGFQVAVITPTTVLATQHFNNFKTRMANWDITMSLMSRSNKFSAKDASAIENGDIQLVIGTHKLLTQNFSNLGLVIIDEEHRFGVKQKDSIQSFNQAHKLSLTATPIPRSLNMALSRLRQLSIMSTPPKQRLPIMTFVEEESDEIVKKSLEREVHRGGQAYIIYNDVASIDQIHKKLDKLCPHITFGVVHGQMPVTAVERQMARFHSQAFQVLIASTIIESGLDVPNANTMIVYRADKLGLAQLHQIRGRVGRSHHQAYAYMLTPNAKIGKKATMRLEAISQSMHLGAGYELSIADLEIRGSGNLLGEEQSGHVNAIGMSYYTELLNQATADNPTTDTDIDLGIVTIIPNNYISDTQTRYQFYHSIASASTYKQLEKITEELIDRFGKIPEETQKLLKLSQLKIDANTLGIISIQMRQDSIIIDVSETPKVDTTHLLQVIQHHPEYSFGGKHHIRINQAKNPIMDCHILLKRLDKSN